MNSNMRNIVATIIVCLSILVGVYVGAWLMFAKPIIICCQAFDTGALTGTMIGWSIIKCVFSSFVCGIIIFIGRCLGEFIQN